MFYLRSVLMLSLLATQRSGCDEPPTDALSASARGAVHAAGSRCFQSEFRAVNQPYSYGELPTCHQWRCEDDGSLSVR